MSTISRVNCLSAIGLFIWGILMFAACAVDQELVPTAVLSTQTLTATFTKIYTSPTATPLPTETPTLEPTPCQTAGMMESGMLPSTFAGSMNYRVYLPPCYGLDGRSYPTLYMLPGNIHTESVWDELGLDEAAESLISRGSLPPFIIAMADGGWLANHSSGGWGSYESVILLELIPSIENNYCVWAEPAGRAIGGLSRGGYWALEIAFRHPEQFASVGGHSAALNDIAAGPDLNPQYTGLNNDLGDLRIYFDIGAQDYLITKIRRLHEEMDKVEIAHTWVLNEGQHDNAYWSAHLDEYLVWYAAPWPIEREQYPLCEG